MDIQDPLLGAKGNKPYAFILKPWFPLSKFFPLEQTHFYTQRLLQMVSLQIRLLPLPVCDEKRISTSIQLKGYSRFLPSFLHQTPTELG